MRFNNVLKTCFICIELFLIGEAVQLISIGADYGLNAYWLNTKSKNNLSLSFWTEPPFCIEIIDSRDNSCVWLGNYYEPTKDDFDDNKILSYSIYGDSLYVKYKQDADTMVVRPKCNVDNQSYTYECFSDYPENATITQIDGNIGLFYTIKIQKYIRYCLIIFLSIPICLLSIRKKKKGNYSGTPVTGNNL